MIREFGILKKIEITEKQNESIDILFDKMKDIAEVIYLSNYDITKNVLNEEFCPIVFLTELPALEIQEDVKSQTGLLPWYITNEEEIPSDILTIWRRDA